MIKGKRFFKAAIHAGIPAGTLQKAYSTAAIPGPVNTLNPKIIRVISVDVTDTIICHPPVAETYSSCAQSLHLSWVPSPVEIEEPFKKAFSDGIAKHPCYGHTTGMSSRSWWYDVVKNTFEAAAATHYANDAGIHSERQWCSDAEFQELFRRIYQRYASPKGYKILSDGIDMLSWLQRRHQCSLDSEQQREQVPSTRYNLGVISNSPTRVVETVLPMLELDHYFDWFLVSRDVGTEKPSAEIFDAAYQSAKLSLAKPRSSDPTNTSIRKVKRPHLEPATDLKKEHILHIGNDFEADFCGARAAGYQALFIDRDCSFRSGESRCADKGIDYPGRSAEDIERHRITSLRQVIDLLSGCDDRSYRN